MAPIGRCKCLWQFLIALAWIESFMASVEAKEAPKVPLVYARLRHDKNFLQLYRYYQQKPPYEERKLAKQLVLVETNDLNETKTSKYIYYENKDVDANTITYDDLIFEALDRTYRIRHTPSYMYNYDEPSDKLRASDRRLVSKARCARDLQYLVDKLNLASRKNAKVALNPELLAFYESYGREEAGLLFGNYHWIGLYRECLRRRIIDVNERNPSKPIHIRGRYCTASLRSPSWDKKIKHKLASPLAPVFERPEQKADYARYFRIQVGICFPESCDSTAIDWAREQVRQLAAHKLSNETFKSYYLADLYCLPDAGSEVLQTEPMARWLILFTITWLSLVIVATMFDSGKKQNMNTWKRLVYCLSVKQNWSRLMHVSDDRMVNEESSNEGKEPKVSNLIFLNFFKVIFMPMVIWIHVALYNKHYNRLPLYSSAYEKPWAFYTFTTGVFIVDWYFVTSGFIISYTMFVTKKVQYYSGTQWLYAIFHRYWRLMPLYVIFFWFSQTLLARIGQGPNWDYGFNNMGLMARCRQESWWYPLTMTSNFVRTQNECVMPIWSACNEMQFYLLAPLLLVGLLRWPQQTRLVSLCIIVVSFLLRFHRIYTHENAKHLELLRPRTHAYIHYSRDLYDVYQFPWYRVGPFVMAILAGHYTYMVQKGNWNSWLYDKKRPDENRPILHIIFLVGLFISVTISLGNFMTNLFPQELEPDARFHASLSIGMSHNYAAIGMIAIYLSIMFGYASRFRPFMSAPIWTVLARLNYSILVSHLAVIVVLCRKEAEVIDMDITEQFIYLLIVMAICYPLSALVTILFELPLNQLEQEFFSFKILKSKPSFDPKSKISECKKSLVLKEQQNSSKVEEDKKLR